MKIKEGFALREIKGQGIVVATGPAALHFNGMIRLNEVGTMIWKLLEQGETERGIVKRIAETYGQDEAVVAADVRELLDQLTGYALEA
ncbi:MAG: hypothetical protein DELT_01390 [Desulfovibrio sp.]